MEIATFFNSKGGDRKYNATHWANYFKLPEHRTTGH